MGRIIGLGFKTQLCSWCSVRLCMFCSALWVPVQFLIGDLFLHPIGHLMPGDLLRMLLILGGLRPVMWLRQCLELSPQPQLLQSQCVKFRDGGALWEAITMKNCAFRRQPGGSGSKCAWQCDLFLILLSGTKLLNLLRLEVRRCFFSDILSMYSGVGILRYVSFHPLRL